ncbi:hypothetical protein SLS58_008001 [Diplodia intermedia]|uniref:Cytochrome P450 n=1 Tax=Diplodia intermedia TaxID=856260 RepID=A0ABR3TJ94_9PEZI
MSVLEADNLRLPLVSAPTHTPTTLVTAVFLALLVLLVSAAFKHLQDDKIYPGLEIVGMRPGDTISQAKQRYTEHSRSILDEGIAKACYSHRLVHRKPFQVLTPTGPLIVLPAKHVDEIKSLRGLSFHETIAKSFFVRLPGMSLASGMAGFRFIVEHDEVFNEVVRLHLTRRLAVHLIARLSARAFLGKAASRDETWLRLSTAYAHDSVSFVRALRRWPPALRPLVQHLLPERRRLRACEAQARNFIASLQEKRRRGGDDGDDADVDDALRWQEEACGRRGEEATDAVGCQLALALVAVHTTSMALARVVFDLCQNPQWIEPLREEARRVLAAEEEGGGGDGAVWDKSTLVRLRLMDSVLKESQRLSPVHLTLMTRVATTDVVIPSLPHLPLPTGTMLAISSSEPLRDPSTFRDPHLFIGDRFLRLREEAVAAASAAAGKTDESDDNSNTAGYKWQYATTSAQHVGFGHGPHACPGRFLAAAELKVALALLLLKYDWRFGEGCEGGNVEVAQDIVPDPGAVE